jgi:hypothetical protein
MQGLTTLDGEPVAYLRNRLSLRHPLLQDNVAYWHIASFRCAAGFGRYRAIADIDQAAPIKIGLRLRALLRTGVNIT